MWLIADLSISAEHADFDEADELLGGLIHAGTGDGENLHTYDPRVLTLGLPGSLSETFTYDAVGNQTRANLLGGRVTGSGTTRTTS